MSRNVELLSRIPFTMFSVTRVKNVIKYYVKIVCKLDVKHSKRKFSELWVDT